MPSYRRIGEGRARRRARVRKKIVAALTYPLVLTMLSVGLVVLLIMAVR